MLIDICETMASIADCEDIPSFLCMEDDSLLDEFLFDDTNTRSPDNTVCKAIEQEVHDSIPISSDKKTSNYKRQLETSLESPVRNSSKERLESPRERAPFTDGSTSGTEKDKVVVKRAVKSLSGTTTMPFFKLDSSWWKKWNFHELGRQKLRSLDSRRRIEHRKFRHEVHKKLTRIELESLKLHTNSHYDLRKGSKLWTLPYPRPLQKSASVTACCPGISRMYCTHELIKRLQRKFTIIRKSREKRARCILKENLPESAFLLRWINYMKVPQVRKRGLNLFKSPETFGSNLSFFEDTPGFLQGKLWYVINAKNIDCSHGARALYAKPKAPRRDKNVRQALMRHVIQYMDVLKNFPELNWLSMGRTKSQTIVEVEDFRRFTSHRAATRFSPKPAWSRTRVVRGHLKCSDRYFLKRRLYTLQECLQNPEWFCQLSEDTHKHDSMAEKDTRKVKHYPKVSKHGHEDLFGSKQSWWGERGGEDVDNLPTIRGKFIPIGCREVRENSLTFHRWNLSDATTSVNRNPVMAGYNLSSCGRNRQEEKNKLSSKQQRLEINNSSFLRCRRRYVASNTQYKKPKQLEIPAECSSSKYRSLYEYISKDSLHVCCKNDPRLTASRKGLSQRFQAWTPITFDLRKGHDSNPDMMNFDPYGTESKIIDAQTCSDNYRLRHEILNYLKYEVRNSEKSVFSIKEKRDVENSPAESRQKETLFSSKSNNNTPAFAGLTPESQLFDLSAQKSNFCYNCLRSDITKRSSPAGEVKNKMFTRTNGVPCLSHPSIRARLTKQDTLYLLDELCCVLPPLPPLPQDKEWPHTMEATLPANRLPVGAGSVPAGAIPVSQPSSSDLTNQKGSYHRYALLGGVAMCEAVQEIKHVGFCAVPMQCSQVIQCGVCGVTFVQLCGPAENITIAKNDQKEDRDFVECFFNQEPLLKCQCSDEVHLENVGNGWSLNNYTYHIIHTHTAPETFLSGFDSRAKFFDTASNETSIQEDTPREDNTNHNNVLVPAVGEKCVQKPLISLGKLNIEEEITVNGSQIRGVSAPNDCKLHKPSNTPSKKYPYLKFDSMRDPFFQNALGVTEIRTENIPNFCNDLYTCNKHDYAKPFNFSEHIPTCQDFDVGYKPDCHFTNIRDGENIIEICDTSLNVSNNHGNDSAEETWEVNTPISRHLDIEPDRCHEVALAAGNPERDYICDDMSTPIVLSAADRVYHVSGTLNTQLAGQCECKLAPIRSASQSNFYSKMMDTISGSIPSHMSYDRSRDLAEGSLLTYEGHDEGSCQGDNLLSRAMHAAGLTDDELQTFLTSDSTLEAVLTDHGELSVDAFLSSKQPGCSKPFVEEKTEVDQLLGPNLDFPYGNLDTRSILPSDDYFSENFRIDNVKEMITPNIRLNTCPAARSYTEAPSFKLPSENDEVGFGEISSKEPFPATYGCGLTDTEATHACRLVQQSTNGWAKLRYEFLNDSHSNQMAAAFNTSANKQRENGTDLDYLQHVESVVVQRFSANTGKEESSSLVSEKFKEDNSTSQSKDYLDNFVLACNQTREVTKENVLCHVDIPGNGTINTPEDNGEDTQVSPIQNGSRLVPEILDLQPLSNNLLEEIKDEEERRDKGREGTYDWITLSNTVGQFKGDSQTFSLTVHKNRSVSTQPANRPSPLWPLRRRELKRTCIKEKALSDVYRSPALCCLPESPTLEFRDKADISKTEAMFKARNIIRVEKNRAVKLNRSVYEVQMGRTRTKQVQTKKCRQSGKSLVMKAAARRTGKAEKSIKMTQRSRRKSKLGSKSKTASKCDSLGESSVSQSGRTPEPRARDLKLQEDVAKTDKVCFPPASASRKKMRKRDDCKKTSAEICGFGLPKDHLRHEILTAETFFKQLRSFSPGFLKNKSPVSGNFLRPPAHTNKINMRFPKPLAASKKMLPRPAGLQKICRVRASENAGQCHNKNNNSAESVGFGAYVYEMLLQKCPVRATCYLERGQSPDSKGKHRTWPNCGADEVNQPSCEVDGDCMSNADSKGGRCINLKRVTNNYENYAYGDVHESSSSTFNLEDKDKVEINGIEENKGIKFDICWSLNDKTTATTATTDNITINEDINKEERTKERNNSKSVNVNCRAYNANNNSNQQDTHAHQNKSNNQEAEEEQVTRMKDGNNSKLIKVDTLQEARPPNQTTQAKDLWHKREVIKNELPRIGKNMENFHAARRKLKEVNARLTRTHGKQNGLASSTTAPVIAKILASGNGMCRRKCEPNPETLGFKQRRERISNGQERERLSANNTAGVEDLDGSKFSLKDLGVSTKENGKLSSNRNLNSLQKDAKCSSMSSKLFGSFKMPDKGGKESTMLSKDLQPAQNEICRNSIGCSVKSDAISEEKTQLRIPTGSSKSRRDKQLGLVRFVERLNSDYGQQLTRGDPHNQTRLEQLCSRYMETLKVRKRLEEKLTGSARSTFNRNDVRAALGMDSTSNQQTGLQKRKRNGSIVELQDNIVCTSLEDRDSSRVTVTTWESDTNENMKILEASEKETMKTDRKKCSQTALLVPKNNESRSGKNKSLNILSVAGKSPFNRLSQASQNKAGTSISNSSSNRRMPRVKSALQLRPDLKESVERLSSQPQSPVVRLQHDISTWEAKFGKHFNLGIFDRSIANRGRSVKKPPSSSGCVAHSSRPTKLDSGPRSKGPLSHHQNVEWPKSIEENSVSNGLTNASGHSLVVTRSELPKPAQSQKSGEDKINTFFGSLLNLINQKEQQKTRKIESCAISEAQAKLYSSATSTVVKQTKRRMGGEEGRENLTKREVKESMMEREGSSSIGTMYRNMLKKIKAKRSSFAIDTEDPWTIPPLPSLKEIAQSLEIPPEFSHNLSEPEPVVTNTSKCILDSSVEVQEGEHFSGKTTQVGTSDVINDCPDTMPVTIGGQPSAASRDQNLSPSYGSLPRPEARFERDFIGDAGLLPLSLKTFETEIINSKSSFMKKNIEIDTELPTSVMGGRNNNPKQKDDETGMFLKSEEELLKTPSNRIKFGIASPKINSSFVLVSNEKSPDAVASKVSVGDSISRSLSLGGGDHGDEKDGLTQTTIAPESPDDQSFAVGFAASSEMLNTAPNPKRKASSESFNVHAEISPRFRSPKTINSNPSISEESSSALFAVSKTESLTWTGSEDLKNCNLESSQNDLQSLEQEEWKVDKPKLPGFEGKSDDFSYRDNSRDNLWNPAGKNSFPRSNFANSEIDDYSFELRARHIKGNEKDRISDNGECVTSFVRRSAPEYEIGASDVDTGSFSSKSIFTRHDSIFNTDFNKFNPNKTAYDVSHSQYEIKPLDALEIQAEKDFGDIYGDNRHKTVGLPGWSPWGLDSRDKQAELRANAENTNYTRGQGASPYRGSMRMVAGSNFDHDVCTTDIQHKTCDHSVKSYLVDPPISGHHYALERPCTRNVRSFLDKPDSAVDASLCTTSWSDSMSSSMTKDVRTPDRSYYPRLDHSEDYHSANIPWDQLSASPTTSFDKRSLTAFDIGRRGLGHSHLTPIQEESEEDQSLRGKNMKE